MNKKKYVIFHITNTRQYFAEFHENTKIKMVKAYLKDVSHLENISLMINGVMYSNDELTLREIVPNSYEIIFRVVVGNVMNDVDETLKENFQLKKENKELQNQIDFLKNENGNNN
jgi:hypothetical protein